MKHDDASNTVRRVIGANIRAAREESGLTQTKLAEMIGINRPYLSRIESGIHNPSVNMLVKIADGLDVPIATLFEGLGACAPSRLPRDTVFSVVQVPKRR